MIKHIKLINTGGKMGSKSFLYRIFVKGVWSYYVNNFKFSRQNCFSFYKQNVNKTKYGTE